MFEEESRPPPARSRKARLPDFRKLFRIVHSVALAALAGCSAVGVTALGVGTATGVQHTLNGIAYRTFTAPLPQVRRATLASLNRMGFRIAAREKTKEGELIKATANDREIEIELAALTPNTTRMRSMVRNGIFMDSATSTEIVLQTERSLNYSKGTS